MLSRGKVLECKLIYENDFYNLIKASCRLCWDEEMMTPYGVNEDQKYNWPCKDYKEETTTKTTITTTTMEKSATRTLAEKSFSLPIIMLRFFFLLS